MSRETILENQSINTDSNEKKLSKKSKVDINILINRVRADQKKERFGNFIFLGLISATLIVAGLIISL